MIVVSRSRTFVWRAWLYWTFKVRVGVRGGKGCCLGSKMLVIGMVDVGNNGVVGLAKGHLRFGQRFHLTLNLGDLGWECRNRVELSGKFGDGTCKGIGGLKGSSLQFVDLGRKGLNLGLEGLVCGFELGKTLVYVTGRVGGRIRLWGLSVFGVSVRGYLRLGFGFGVVRSQVDGRKRREVEWGSFVVFESVLESW